MLGPAAGLAFTTGARQAVPETNLGGLLLVTGVAFAVPLLVGLVRLPVSVAALELLAGAALGPGGLALLEVDPGLEVLAGLGLAFTLFLAGLETDLGNLRAMDARTVAASAGIGLAVALGAGAALAAAGLVASPLLVAIALWSTSPGVVGSVAEAGAAATAWGRRIAATATVSALGSVVLLSVFVAGAGDASRGLAALAVFAVAAALVAAAVVAVGTTGRVSALLRARQEGRSQLRVRGALLLLVACLWAGQRLGVSAVLAAYGAGVVLRVVDRHPLDHPRFRTKLDAVGHGVFTPVFLVVTGARLQVGTAGEAGVLGLAALLLVVLLAVSGAAALVARRGVAGPGALAATLLGATTLPVVVAAVELGRGQGLLAPSVGTALVLASLTGFAVFPVVGLRLLVGRRSPGPRPRTSSPPR